MSQLKLLNEAADPAAEVNTSIVYAKDVQGDSQAFVRTEDGRVSQLTPTVRLVPPGASLSDAIASVAGETIELLPGEHTLDADAEDTVTLRFRGGAVLLVPEPRSIGSQLDLSEGGRIRPAAEAIVTINGPVMMPDTAQCFDISLGGRFCFGDGTISYLTPCHFGALLDNATPAEAAIQAAIDSLPAKGGVVRFPLGDMVSYGQINIKRDHVIIEGMGWGSRLRLQTGAAATLFLFEKPPKELVLGCGIRNIKLSSGRPSGDVPKTAIDVHDAREFLAERIAIQPWFGGAGTASVDPSVKGSVGLRVRGRDAGTYRKLFIDADVPILLDSNADHDDLKDIDHHTFEDLDLVSTEPPDPDAPPNPVIRIKPGFVMRNTTFRGYQAWVHGGLEWIDDKTSPRELSNNVAIENVRAEQMGSNPEVFAIDIQKDPKFPLHELSVKNCLLPGAAGGVRATGVENVVYDRSVRYVGAGTALVTDGTVDSGAPRGYLDGLLMTCKPLTETEIEIGPGRCRSDDDRFDIELTAPLPADLRILGPGGRDQGPFVADTWYSVRLIDKSNHGPNAPKLILSTSPTAPLLQGGFDLKRRLGWIRSDPAKRIRKFNQRGSGRTREIWYDEPLAALNALTDGAALAFTDVPLSSWLPPTAQRVHLLAGFLAPAAGAATDTLDLRPAGAAAADGPFHFVAGGTLTAKKTFQVEMPCGAAQAVEYKVSDAHDRADLWVLGYDDEL
jgi:hypothetical protein